MTLPHSPSF